MESIKIQFDGIRRDTDEGASIDGQMSELINARISSTGELIPVPSPTRLATFNLPQAHKVYVHSVSSTKNYLCFHSDGLSLLDIKNQSATTIPFGEGTEDLSEVEISSVGNTIVVSYNNELHYILWDGTQYSYLGTIPDLPESYFNYEKRPDYYKEYKIDTSGIDDIKKKYEKVIAEAQKNIGLLQEEGYFFSPFLVRIAYRLFDGRHIKPSNPILVYPRGNIIAVGTIKGFKAYGSVSNVGGNYKVNLYPSSLEYSVHTNVAELSKWKDIISGIDVFVSSPIYLYDKVELFLETFPPSGTYYQFSVVSDTELVNRTINKSSFYLFTSLNTEKTHSGILKMETNIETREALKDDGFSHHTLSAKRLYNYNSRMHAANTKYKLFDGFKPSFFLTAQKDYTADPLLTRTYQIDIYVDIKTESGNKRVKCSQSSYSTSTNAISAYMYYPDSRAYKMTVFDHKYPTYHRTYDLKPHPYMNGAYCFAYGNNINPIIDSFEGGAWVSGAPSLSIDSIDPSPNKLRVSEVGNPFYFPMENTYTPSVGEIRDIISNTVAISQGQFGQYPLYLFCADGIYSLQTGTSGIVYQSWAPVSRHVITGRPIGIDNGVVFQSVGGLFAISGATVEALSEPMKGYLSNATYPSATEQTKTIIEKISKLSEMDLSILSQTLFEDYLNGSSMGYDFDNSDIIISNSQYNYSYCLSIKTGKFHKRNISPSFFINDYPDCAFTKYNQPKGVEFYRIEPNQYSFTKILAISRPIKFGSTSHKRITQSALRGIIHQAIGRIYFRGNPVMFDNIPLNMFDNAGFYLLGSNDAANYTLIGGKDNFSSMRDIVTVMNKSKPYKYFIVAIAGGIRTDVSINFAEFHVETAFDNRLR